MNSYISGGDHCGDHWSGNGGGGAGAPAAGREQQRWGGSSGGVVGTAAATAAVVQGCFPPLLPEAAVGLHSGCWCDSSRVGQHRLDNQLLAGLGNAC